MSPDRNAHKALNLLDFEPGSLLHHLPSYYHNSDSAIELASDRKKWKDVFDKNLDYISLSMLCPSRDL